MSQHPVSAQAHADAIDTHYRMGVAHAELRAMATMLVAIGIHQRHHGAHWALCLALVAAGLALYTFAWRLQWRRAVKLAAAQVEAAEREAERAWVQRMAEWEEERGEIVPGGAQGGAVARHRRRGP